MWRIRIHATYKTGMERICHTCVTNALEICEKFVRIIHTCKKYEVWIGSTKLKLKCSSKPLVFITWLIKWDSLVKETTLKSEAKPTHICEYIICYKEGAKLMVQTFHRFYMLGFQISFKQQMSRDMKKPTKWLCAQRRLRSAWAFLQSDQSLRCALNG